MTTYQVFGLGAALVDTEIKVDELFLQNCDIIKGNMTLVDEARQQQLMHLLEQHLVTAHKASGGSAANSIIAHSALGGSAFYACKVGHDTLGEFYLNDLNQAGVAVNKEKAQQQGITGKCLVLITPDAERTMNTFLGISETLSQDNIDFAALQQSQWLYMEGYLVTSETGRAAAIKAREFAQQHGVKVALSLSDPGIVQFFKDGLKHIIGSHIDMIFCNEQEAFQWLECDTIEQALEGLKAYAKQFVITRSSKGAVIYDGETVHYVDAVPVQALDTNGAGDAFAGAFLYAINHGMDYLQAGKLACKTASAVVGQYGPRLSEQHYRQLLAD